MKNKETICSYVLNNLISSILKRDDAPCSSETHMNMIIYELISHTDVWEEWDDDAKDIVNGAIEEMELLGKIK